MGHHILIYCGPKLIYVKEYDDIDLALSESADLREHIVGDADVAVILTNDADRVKAAIEEAENAAKGEKHPFAI